MSVAISIIIPVHNSELHLSACLDSVVAQNFSDYEIILVNGGSADNSLGICRSYAETYSNIRLVSQPDKGAGGDRNKGISIACGKYIVFVDSDDVIHPNFCCIMYGAMKKYNTDLGICRYTTFNTDPPHKNNSHANYSLKIFASNAETWQNLFAGSDWHDYIVYQWAKIFNRDFLIENNILFPEHTGFEDLPFGIDVCKNCRSAFLIDDPLYFYRRSPGGQGTSGLNSVAKLVGDRCRVNCSAVTAIYDIDDVILPEKLKRILIDRIMALMVDIYLKYQKSAFESLIFSDGIRENCDYYLFGASTLGAYYCNLLKHKTKNIIFVDNDEQKQGNTFSGYPVISPKDLRERFLSSSRAHELFITSMYYLEIYLQVLREGLVPTTRDIFPYKLGTELSNTYYHWIGEMLNMRARFHYDDTLYRLNDGFAG